MKYLKILLSLVFLATLTPPVAAQSLDGTKQESVSIQGVQVYYFHYTRRCATCQAVEDESRSAIEKLYPEKVKSGEIIFLSLNLEEKANEALAEKLNVSGQSLLVTKGDKKIDLTDDGFMYARTNPEKLQGKIKSAIDPLI